MATHAYRQTLKYEVARELLNARIADLTDQITTEEAKPRPDARVIEQLETAMADIGTSISQLDVTNEPGLDAVIEADRRAEGTGD